ncbi:hypothetical protein [Dyella acidisoli]|uniref:Uncharacterized protein n=1 Tax=Dyella acidisoli TaxID=1867834 RepID=A0ABQ5XPN2_9GAMM|nr:hypothetical protein [Dyella acidisoli]GLQ93038.1 hypothetical protein GCM10007901_19890 [Dyella acidisoli]
MSTPDIKHNTNPKVRYEITLTIKDAPGLFDSVTGFMQYDVANEQCTPYERFTGIYRTPPGQSPPIAFSRVSDNQYKGTLHLDLLQDEDYYGLGVCHWSMTAAIARLKFQEATFSPDISQKQIVAQQSVTIYFPKSGYGDNSIKDMHYAGSTMSETVAHYRDDFFSVTLSSKERFE